MAYTKSDQTSIESVSFHSSLSNEIDTDGDSNMFDSDGDILPQFCAQPQDDAVVEAYYKFESTLTDSETESELKPTTTGKPLTVAVGRLSFTNY